MQTNDNVTLVGPSSGQHLVLKYIQPDEMPAYKRELVPLAHQDQHEVLFDAPGLIIERWRFEQDEAGIVARRPHIKMVIEEGFAQPPRPPTLIVPNTVSGQMTIEGALKWHGVDKLHEAGYRGKGARVAILDTGVSQELYIRHQPRIVAARSTVQGEDYIDAGAESGHGSFCFETVATFAPEAELVVIKVLSSQDGYGYTSSIVAGLDLAFKMGCGQISMSLGGPGDPTDAMCQAVDKLAQMGVLPYVAAGNEQRGRSNYMANVSHPGCAALAITVAAVDENSALAAFSNWGDVLDLSGLGVGIWQAGKPWSGTSMATPMIAGIGVCLQGANSDKAGAPIHKADEVRKILYSGARDTGLPPYQEGLGIVNGGQVLRNISPAPSPEGDSNYFPNLVRVSKTAYLAGDEREAVHTKRRKDIGHFTPKS